MDGAAEHRWLRRDDGRWRHGAAYPDDPDRACATKTECSATLAAQCVAGGELPSSFRGSPVASRSSFRRAHSRSPGVCFFVPQSTSCGVFSHPPLSPTPAPHFAPPRRPATASRRVTDRHPARCADQLAAEMLLGVGYSRTSCIAHPSLQQRLLPEWRMWLNRCETHCSGDQIVKVGDYAPPKNGATTCGNRDA